MNGIECDIKRLRGKPVLAGTRISVAQVVASVTEQTVDWLCDEMDLDESTVTRCLESVSAIMAVMTADELERFESRIIYNKKDTK